MCFDREVKDVTKYLSQLVCTASEYPPWNANSFPGVHTHALLTSSMLIVSAKLLIDGSLCISCLKTGKEVVELLSKQVATVAGGWILAFLKVTEMLATLPDTLGVALPEMYLNLAPVGCFRLIAAFL